MNIKICGLSTKEAVDTAVASGATHLGFILSLSRRQVSPEKVADLTKDIPKRVKKVGVFVNEPLDYVKKAIQIAQLDIVQLHGDEDMNYINQLSFPVIKAVRPDQDFRLYKEVILLFDSPQGGSGQTFDWDSINPEHLGADYFIAGGLSPENVGRAIQHFPNAFGVDVSSGVETAGKKDVVKIKSFIQKASLASSQQLFAEFLRITGKLNKFKISPYLMGSLAIEQLGNFFTNPDDIDIQLEKDDFENFSKLTEIMEDLGYQLIDLHEHKFEKGRFHVGFANVETIDSYANIDYHELQQNKQVTKERYWFPNLEQSIKIYQTAIKDSWRDGKPKDQVILDKLIDYQKRNNNER